MSLSVKQRRFTLAIARLIQYAEVIGYGLTFGRAYASEAANAADGGIPNSNHRRRLAVDFNVFDGQTGDYLRGEEAERAHNLLHDFWDHFPESAPRIDRDLNHYSFAHGGVR